MKLSDDGEIMAHNNRIHALYAGFKSTTHGLNVSSIY